MPVALALWLLVAPGTQAAERGRAAQAMAQGRYDEAAAVYRELLKTAPDDTDLLLDLADAELSGGHSTDAVNDLRRVTTKAPSLPAGWYALGRAYDGVAQDARATFDRQPDEEAWRQLIVADGFFAHGQLTEAFVLYRAVLDAMPSAVAVHDSIADIYERTGHREWAQEERPAGVLPPAACAARKALCEFRAGRPEIALVAALEGADADSRYWRIRAATALALAAFARLDALPDSAERRTARATFARSEERYTDAVTELTQALRFAPGDPGLSRVLGAMYVQARDFDHAIETLTPLLQSAPDDLVLLKLVGSSLLESRRPEDAAPILARALARAPGDAPLQLLLGRAQLQQGHFAEALPLLEPQLDRDADGSLHMQVARAYAGLGQTNKVPALQAQAAELQRQADDRRLAAAERTIAPPKTKKLST
jgi:predicted Zn-dependent protease